MTEHRDGARAAIFDLDGTLAETAPDLIGAANALLEVHGLPPFDAKAARLMAGLGGKALIRHGFASAGDPRDESEINALFPHYLELYEARIDRDSRLYEGVPETLDRLAAAGWRLGVCTNKPEGLARLLLERLGVLGRFAALVGADTLPVRKPDPRPLLHCIAEVGGAPARSALIGDSRTDRDAARNARVASVLVRFGYAQEPIDSLSPEAKIDHFSDLEAALETLAL